MADLDPLDHQNFIAFASYYNNGTELKKQVDICNLRLNYSNHRNFEIFSSTFQSLIF
jgi:hypothetical protein